MTKEQFDKLYVGKNIAVSCDTKEKAIKFLELADKFGYEWSSGESLLEETNYDVYREKTCYALFVGQYSREEFYKKENYKIVKFQLSPKDLLEDGFRVVPRNGEERFTLIKTKTLHNSEGSCVGHMNWYNSKLVHNSGFEELDIVKIYNREDELIWEREEKSQQELEIKRIENEMRRLADDLQKLKEVK